MIVCPHCRNVNDEEAKFCSRCGRSLEPGLHALGPTRREPSEEEDLDLPPPKPRSRWTALVTLVGLLAAAGVGAFLWSLRPDPCDGKNFTSERFGYCLTVPDRWEAGPATIGNVAVDEISLPTDAATVIIVAVDLPTDQSLEDYARLIRERDSGSGLDPGPLRDTFLDGVQAVEWDIAHETDTGQEFVMRQVVAIRAEVGWIISLSDSVEGLRLHQDSFDSMLSSWKFR